MKQAMQCDPQLLRQRQHTWYGLDLGRTLLEKEVIQLNGVLSNLFGYHLLQVGQIGDADLLAGSRITHRMVVAPGILPPATLVHPCTSVAPGILPPATLVHPCTSVAPGIPPPATLVHPCTSVAPGILPSGIDTVPKGQVCLYAGADALPMASDSIDVIVLPHTLEFETDPHQVIREAERVLIPEGHVVILGFNPWSLWGLWRLFLRRGSYPPWCGNFRGLTRIKDWLALLGFDNIEEQGYFFRPPLQNVRVMQKLGFMENVGARWWPGLAGCYVLLAKKRVATLTPIKPSWRRSRLVNAGGIVEPTASHIKHD